MKKDIYAGFWLRVIAYIVDTAIIMVVLGGVSQLFFLINATETMTGVTFIVLVWLYYALMESSQNQGTLGKMAVGLHVVDENKKPISFNRATGRFFGKIISSVILGVGFLMIAFTKKKQGLHDMISECLVIKRD